MSSLFTMISSHFSPSFYTTLSRETSSLFTKSRTKSRGKIAANRGKLRISCNGKSQGFCSCGRRHIIGASTGALLFNFPGKSNSLQSDSRDMLNKIHPSKPDWYEECFALALNQGMKSYEAEIAGYKAQLFNKLKEGDKSVLELGIGTGPNFKYYASGAGIRVIGVDPNKKMEKYARAAALTAGLPPTDFKFIPAVGEALPVLDSSMDAVIGTLVLCSVKDVSMALEEVKRVLKPGGFYIFIEHVAAPDGTTLRMLQTVLDPLQQFVADGCHLTRETGKLISEVGFSNVDINTVFLSRFSILGSQVYGIAYK